MPDQQASSTHWIASVNIQIIISTVSQLQNQPFDIIGQVVILRIMHEKFIGFFGLTILRSNLEFAVV
jgi:hypothetical protein